MKKSILLALAALSLSGQSFAMQQGSNISNKLKSFVDTAYDSFVATAYDNGLASWGAAGVLFWAKDIKNKPGRLAAIAVSAGYMAGEAYQLWESYNRFAVREERRPNLPSLINSEKTACKRLYDQIKDLNDFIEYHDIYGWQDPEDSDEAIRQKESYVLEWRQHLATLKDLCNERDNRQ